MLNKYKINIIYVLNLVEEAVDYLYTKDITKSNEIIKDICEAINFINNIIAETGESLDIIEVGNKLGESLKLYQNQKEKVFDTLHLYSKAISAIKIQYKVLFLPLATEHTWDSMESVYHEFAAESMFKTEVVAVPLRLIFKGNENDYNEIYEDFLTPYGIPITHYDNYSFEDDLPDIVFCNYCVMSINKYLISNIKHYTGLIVYIPYYIYSHDLCHNYGDFRNALFMQTEGDTHQHADIYITAGESYMKHFSNSTSIGNKMVALGSPKTDSLYNYKQKGNWPRYDEWDKKLNKKTCFLLNTHFQFIGFKDLLETYKYIIDYIISDNETALIWRPHPATDMFVKYNTQESISFHTNLIEHAKTCERIIFDETPTIISALMYSKALITTDYSSVVSMAVCLDIPSFIMACNPKEMTENIETYYKPIYENYLQIRKQIDRKNLTTITALPTFGLDTYLKKGETYIDKCYFEPVKRFINNIKNGEDPKAELRREYKKQLLNNTDGTCAKHILDYIKLIIAANNEEGDQPPPFKIRSPSLG